MNKEELEKYIEKDFLPSLLSNLPNIPDLAAENARLKAEVERLRKAGDAMADAAYAHCMCQDCEELRDQWRDAKRGNQP